MNTSTQSVPVVHIVHCIDTEGPLYESLTSTFERLRAIFDIDVKPSPENLVRLQRQEINLEGLEVQVAKVLAPELLNYHVTWEGIDGMLREMMSPAFRKQHLDSFGGGWIYNWHCLDHVGFRINPRRRDMGIHNVFDHYREMVDWTNSFQDGIHFHHHPVSFSGEAHRCATHFFSHTPIIFEILAHRIIDRQWFPCVFRPGFHAERPDSHWFLEQFIPFDFSNQATDEDYSAQKDLSGGRFGDWRRAPKTWTPYHPSHDDYQVEGDCRRLIARCLNVGTRLRLLTEADVEQAFSEASDGKPVVLAFTNHDFRDMRADVRRVCDLLTTVRSRFAGVKYRFCEARDAMRGALALTKPKTDFSFQLSIEGNILVVESSHDTFGPQPFLAIKSTSGQYLHDNLDFQEPFRRWTYTFDENTLNLQAVESVGVGGCDAYGSVAVTVLDPATGKLRSGGY